MGAVPVRSFLSPTWGTASIRTHAVAPFPHRRELASVRLPSQTLFETADEPRQAMSSHLRDSSEAWTQSISSSDLYHHEQYRYHHHNTTSRAEASTQPGWPSKGNEVKAEAPRRSPPTPLKLPQSAEPADEANLSRQLDEVVDLLSQQPRSDGGPRRPMNAFLVSAQVQA
ncbi:hypothetical protein BCV69DRAFT_140659 [Microstroma glucosiphilum]|uniref:Uncharacterized protein n=1 Tax=Pseudomicrostroma glucosiphilum TaxID=1684307 RepID=A0A316UAS8_9BASI|nr:hypothetical protein BCV69DRAFT_140659 [Pseudomicrostroma glucosiphilum]PWN22317.1 hypothetical protein BCV69DRAFT_140659 [Pseudomicrostroma glucosiphilum]